MCRLCRITPAFFYLVLILGGAVNANDLSGYIGIEGRYFFDEPLFSGQSEHNASLASEFEYYRDLKEGDQRFVLTAKARIDSEDSDRSHFDFNELYWWGVFDGCFGECEVYAGLRKIFWGVTESVHLVDIINQTDNLENIDGEDKLGQSMIQLVSARDWGTLSAFIMPYFRERQFVGEQSRLRAGFPVANTAQYQDSDEQQHVDYAFRWSHYIDIWDIGLSHFVGTSRDPVFSANILPGAEVELLANYQQIEQTGLDLQATIDTWLIKFEGVSIYEKSYGRRSAAAGGVEYSFFAVGGTSADLGIVVEYQFDDRVEVRERTSQNDLVFGARWAFNDLDGSEMLALISQDLEYGNRFFSLELSRRLNDKWKIEAETRLFSNINEESPEFDFRQDDYLQLELRRYF
ncbi:MAG: hypothetical protein K6L76_09585 [Agarilytica sp.]